VRNAKRDRLGYSCYSSRVSNLTLDIFRGDKFEIRVTLTDQAGDPIDASTDFTPRMELRQDVAQATPDGTATITVSGTGNNVLDVMLDATQTLALEAGVTYYAEILLVHNTLPGEDQRAKTRYALCCQESVTRR